jgi:hypothetical protein
MIKCDAVECLKILHIECSNKNISNSNNEAIPGKHFCTIGCHKLYLRDYSSLHLGWKNDGKADRADPQDSEYYLIKWMASGGNLSRWREPGNGTTNIQLRAIISQWLVDQGVKMKQFNMFLLLSPKLLSSAKDVQARILCNLDLTSIPLGNLKMYIRVVATCVLTCI